MRYIGDFLTRFHVSKWQLITISLQLPSVPDLILPAVTEGASSGPGSPESSDAPLTPGLSPTTPTESPSGSLNRQGTISVCSSPQLRPYLVYPGKVIFQHARY